MATPDFTFLHFVFSAILHTFFVWSLPNTLKNNVSQILSHLYVVPTKMLKWGVTVITVSKSDTKQMKWSKCH